LATAVAKALQAANATEDDLRRLVIPRLATWDPQSGREGAAKRVVAPADRLLAGERAVLRPLVDALVHQRLLVSSVTESATVYEVAHEALLRVAPLDRLIYARREKFELQRMLLVEARDWLHSGERVSRLARAGERLKDADALLADEDFGPPLHDDATGVARYVAACAAEQQALVEREKARELERQRAELDAANARADAARRLSRRTLAGLAVALALAVVASAAGLYAYWQQQDAVAQKAVAEDQRELAQKQRAVAETATQAANENLRLSKARRARLQAEQARREFQEGNTTIAALLALEALPDPKAPAGDRPYVPEAEAALLQAMQPKSVQVAVEKNHGAIAISPDGKLLAVAGGSGLVLYSTRNGAREKTLDPKVGRISSVTFSQNGDRLIATGESSKTSILVVSTGQLQRTLGGPGTPARKAALSRDGQRLMIAYGKDEKDPKQDDAAYQKGNQLALFAFPSGEQLGAASGFPSPPLDVAFTSNPSQVFVISRPNYLWDFSAGDSLPLNDDAGKDYISNIVLGPGELAAASADKNVSLYSLEGFEVRGRLTGAREDINSLSFSSDGNLLITSHGNKIIGSEENVARIWDLGSAAQKHLLGGHRAPVVAARFSLNSRVAMTLAMDGAIRLWHVQTGSFLGELEPSTRLRPEELLSDAAGGTLVVADNDRDVVEVWTVAIELQELVESARKGALRCLTDAEREAYDLDRDQPAWCSDLKKWPLTGDAQVRTVDPVLALARLAQREGLAPKLLPDNKKCLSDPKFGALLRFQNLFVRTQSDYLDHWPEARLLLKTIPRDDRTFKTFAGFSLDHLSRDDYAALYKKYRLDLVVDHLLAYRDRYAKLSPQIKKQMDLHQYERDEKNIKINFPKPDNECLAVIGFADPEYAGGPVPASRSRPYTGTYESIHEWGYFFWHRRAGEGNDSSVYELLKLIKQRYG
jgi:WD40 repeat protein